MSETEQEAPTKENVIARFATLPERITKKQIAWATFRQPPSVQNWINASGNDFPEPIPGVKEGRTLFRDRDAVRDWYLDQPFAEPGAVPRGRPAGRTSAPKASAPGPRQVREAFAKLPRHIRRTDIAAATGLTLQGVENWATEEDFPAPVAPELTPEQEAALNPRGKMPDYYENADVMEWCLARLEAGTRQGPRDTVTPILHARPDTPFVTLYRLRALLGVAPRAVSYWTQQERPGDPLPGQDDSGAREWAALRSWLLRRNDPAPAPGASPREVEHWVMQYAGRRDAGSLSRDVHGLTLAQRDAVERGRLAAAAGAGITAQWLADKLNADEAIVEGLMNPTTKAPGQRWLKLPAIADALGVELEPLRAMARSFGKAEQDPFPAAAVGGARDLEAVRDWMTRRGLLEDGATAPEA